MGEFDRSAMIPNLEALRGSELLRQFELRRGFDDNLKDQVIAKSRYPHIVASTPRDLHDPKRGYGRFTSRETLEKWLETHEFVYPLVAPGESLVGQVWFRPETLPDRGQRPLEGRGSSHTFATRLYEYVGQGLSSPFYDAAIKEFVDELSQRQLLHTLTGISLETAVDNVPARKGYERSGWTDTYAGYEVDIVLSDGSSYTEQRALMEMLPEAIGDAYWRAAAAGGR